MSYSILRDSNLKHMPLAFDSLNIHVSQKNNIIITGGMNGQIIIFHLKNNTYTVLPKAHKQAIVELKLNHTTLFAAGWDNLLSMYDLQTGTLLRVIDTEHSEQITGLQLYAHYAITCANDGKIKIFNPALKFACVATLDVHSKGGVNAIHCGDDEPWIVSAGDDGRIVITDMNLRTSIASFRVAKQAMYTVQRFYNSIYVGTASLGVQRYNAKRYCKELEYKASKASAVYTMQYSDNKVYAAMGANLIIYEANSGKILRAEPIPDSSRITGIAVTSDMYALVDMERLILYTKNYHQVLKKRGNFKCCLLIPLVDSKQVERMMRTLVQEQQTKTYTDITCIFK